MIKVELNFFAGIRNDIGFEEIELETKEDSTIEDIVKLLIRKYKKRAQRALLTKDKKSYKFIVFINRMMVSDPKEVRLRDGDNVYFVPPVSGG